MADQPIECTRVRCGGCLNTFGVTDFENTDQCPYCGYVALAASEDTYELWPKQETDDGLQVPK